MRPEFLGDQPILTVVKTGISGVGWAKRAQRIALMLGMLCFAQPTALPDDVQKFFGHALDFAQRGDQVPGSNGTPLSQSHRHSCLPGMTIAACTGRFAIKVVLLDAGFCSANGQQTRSVL